MIGRVFKGRSPYGLVKYLYGEGGVRWIGCDVDPGVDAFARVVAVISAAVVNDRPDS